MRHSQLVQLTTNSNTPCSQGSECKYSPERVHVYGTKPLCSLCKWSPNNVFLGEDHWRPIMPGRKHLVKEARKYAARQLVKQIKKEKAKNVDKDKSARQKKATKAERTTGRRFIHA